ncbi:MAG TPA: flagellar hook-associated protein FlgK [Clostridia bacterium]|nr:flagellar hook-associated protein FlgK [Clostridia bacterium]
MSGTFFGFNTALRGLFAQQKAMNTSSHNIANANTPGYTRQQVIMEASTPFPVPSVNRPGGAGQLGTGVDVNEVRRIRDKFLDYQIRMELGSLGQWEQREEVLKRVETVFMEPSETGLSALFDQFWTAWQELSKNAESSPIRTTVRETSIALAEAFRHTYRQMDDIRNDLETVADIKARQVNTLARQVDGLNKQIANIVLSGDSPNDLMDQRDLLLDELSSLVDFTIEETLVDRPTTGGATVRVPDGQIKIYLGTTKDAGNLLVDVNQQPDNVREIAYSSTDNDFKWVADGSTSPPTLGNSASITNGEMLGLTVARDLVMSYLDDINGLARDLMGEMNKLHQEGWDLNGNQEVDQFFIGIDASDLDVHDEIKQDVSKIRASAVQDNKGNGEVALKIAQLKNAIINGGVKLENTTIDRYYNDLISRIGVAAHESSRMVTNQEALVDQLKNRKETVSGVSLDEEMAYLLQYQRAYQAAARVIMTLDEIVQTILSIKR